MKFYKRQSLNSHSPQDNTFAVEQDGRAIIDTTESLRLPRGNNSQRPTDTVPGQIRQNTELSEIETLVNAIWERNRTVRPGTIAVQNLGSGNYYSNIFGPLNNDYQPSYDKSAANIQVYVDNVFQIPFTNYDITVDPTPVVSQTTATTTAGSTILYLDDVTNVQPGCRITGSASINSSTTVIGTITGTTWVEMSSTPISPIPALTSLTFVYNTGSYLSFTGAVPAKPVVVILGYDGYFPP
jgi:hypothetical protein